MMHHAIQYYILQHRGWLATLAEETFYMESNWYPQTWLCAAATVAKDVLSWQIRSPELAAPADISTTC